MLDCTWERARASMLLRKPAPAHPAPAPPPPAAPAPLARRPPLPRPPAPRRSPCCSGSRQSSCRAGHGTERPAARSRRKTERAAVAQHASARSALTAQVSLPQRLQGRGGEWADTENVCVWLAGGRASPHMGARAAPQSWGRPPLLHTVRSGSCGACAIGGARGPPARQASNEALRAGPGGVVANCCRVRPRK